MSDTDIDFVCKRHRYPTYTQQLLDQLIQMKGENGTDLHWESHHSV